MVTIGLSSYSSRLWIVEATSVIRRLAYHKIILPHEGETAIEDIFALGVEIIPTDQSLCREAWKWAEQLQQARIYDSLYVALAERYQADLWTDDKRLFNALKQHKVEWVYKPNENQ